MQKIKTLRGLYALSPIMVLLTVYLAGSIIAGDFYRIPIAVAFIAAAVYAVIITKGSSLNERIDNFSRGAANTRIMYMVWIFVLAGAFAKTTEAMGAIDATVVLARNAIPASYLPAGIFIAGCFVSLSIGTSVGTIVALTPVVTTLAAQIGCDVAWMVAIVVGGAFFGDNLSFISDTTIAATQTQGCSMRSKFYTNILLVAPAAIITLLIYAFSGNSISSVEAPAMTFNEVLKCLPYVIVIIVALLGVNVLTVLLLGIVSAAILGFAYGSFNGIEFCTYIGNGVMGMGELIIVTMLAGGVLEMVRLNGGIDYLIQVVTARINSKRGAEFAITGLTALANVCTANNTIAILSVGDISRDIAKQYKISPRRSASLMDTASCFVQGVIPYGAQLLMASGLALVSPVAIIPYLYYPMCVGAAVVISIMIKREKR
ncbi:MAG: Na+/H+ antiporter NhaC family protein [Bacteroidaceae bacterium]|nr:Na+/H+ antiporter NhaC family protein [Bacteroidaceae bacterium]